MVGNRHFNIQLQRRFPIVGVAYSRVGSHLALWFHFGYRCLMVELRLRREV